MTNEEIAIQQHLSKPRPSGYACGCMGPQPLPGEEGKPWAEQKCYPMCNCSMAWVEEVNANFYVINEVRNTSGITHTATLLGPVGGPYVKGYN